MLGLVCALLLGAEISVDLREYITQPDPGYRHRGLRWGVYESYLSNDGHYRDGTWTQALRVEPGHPALREGSLYGLHWVGLGALGTVGVNIDLAGPTGPWRCFADLGHACFPGPAEIPFQAAPLTFTIPVLAASEVKHDRVTALGREVYPAGQWTGHDVWLFDAARCVPYAHQQRVWQRVRLFIVDRVAFGGDLGERTSVLVLEQESRSHALTDETMPGRDLGGHRLERYYFVTGWGMAKQWGRNVGQIAGIYDDNAAYGEMVWSRRAPGDFEPRPLCQPPGLPWLTIGR